MILLLPFKLACYKHQRVRAEFVTPGFLLHPSAVQWDAYIRGAYTNDVKIILEAFFAVRTAFMKHVKAIDKEIHGSLIAEQNRNTVTFGLMIGIVSVPKPTFKLR